MIVALAIGAGLVALYLAMRWDLTRRHRRMAEAAQRADRAQKRVAKLAEDVHLRRELKRRVKHGAKVSKALAAQARRRALRRDSEGSAEVANLAAIVAICFLVVSAFHAVAWELPLASVWFGFGCGVLAFYWNKQPGRCPERRFHAHGLVYFGPCSERAGHEGPHVVGGDEITVRQALPECSAYGSRPESCQ